MKSISDIMNEQMTIEAIWLDRPVVTNEGMRVRIAKDMLICVEDGKIKEQGNFTHRIVECHGTLLSQELMITAKNLKTLQIEKVVL